MGREFLEEIEKIKTLDEQIREEREAETEKVDKMTDKERIEYLKQKESRAAEFAKNISMNQKTFVISDKKEV